MTVVSPGKIDIPTMIIHGTDDEVVPYWHGTELYAKAGNPYKVLRAKRCVRGQCTNLSLTRSLLICLVTS